MTTRRFAFGLFCISAALLGYELLLMRLLSLALWGHFAAFVISIAMLGLAASGLVLHFFRDRVVTNAAGFFSISAGLFAAVAPLAFAVSQLLPFKPFLLAWSAGEYFYLALRILIFFGPFFLGGVAIGVPFVAQVLPAGRLYFWNLLGSAALVPPVFIWMSEVHPVRLLAPVSLLGFLAAGQALTRARTAAWLAAGFLVVLGVGAVPFRYSEYKDLSKTLTLPEASVLEENYDPNGVVQTVSSKFTRYLPGLSLNFAGELPRSELVFVDGSAMEVVFDLNQSLRAPAFLRMSPEAFSYQLASRPRVLLLYGGPLELLRGVALGARTVCAVDDVKARADAIDRAWGRLGASPFQRAGVRRIDDEARHFLAATHETFDVIVVSLLASHGSSTAGAASLDASGLFTVEGISSILDRLSPAGHAAFGTWVENPPRSGVRLAALLIDTLRRRGVTDPASHLLGIRSWSTLTFFLTLEPYGTATIDSLKHFAADNSFDLVFYDGMTTDEANRFNVIPDEPYFPAVRALVGGENRLFRRTWPFRLDAPSDDRPFFNHHFRWRAVPTFVATLGREWVPFVEWGYLSHVASLVVVAVLGVLLLIVPCAATRSRPPLRPCVLFLALGVAYMAVEIWAIYKLVLLLSWPTVSSAVVLTALLAASGAGAALLARGETAMKVRRVVPAMIGMALLLSLAEFSPLKFLFFSSRLPVRIIVAALWIAVPAFFMGFPFPFALGELRRREEVPWALALNGFGSVLGSLGATLVAVHFGLTALALVAAGLYTLVAILMLAPAHTASSNAPIGSVDTQRRE